MRQRPGTQGLTVAPGARGRPNHLTKINAPPKTPRSMSPSRAEDARHGLQSILVNLDVDSGSSNLLRVAIDLAAGAVNRLMSNQSGAALSIGRTGMAGQFDGKVAIVTGGASGIGAAVARQLAREGCRVVIADRDSAGLEIMAAEIGRNAVPYEINVADALEVEAMIGFAERECGGLNLAVNNAGISGPAAPTADYPLDGWQQVMDINLNSVFYCMKYEIPAMLRAGGGAIVNMASILGSVGFANSPAYVAAKHALVGLTQNAAIEYARHGIRVNAVGPGFIDTPLLSKNLDQSTLSIIAGLHPIGRLGRAEEVAALTCFLLSEPASFITGSYHLVDGGYVAQ